jgi:hypothetical protein
MRQIVLMLGAVCLVIACGTGTWIVARPPVEPFLAPEAFDVLVHRPGLITVEISYQVPAPPLEWHQTLARRLTTSGWTAPVHYPMPAKSYHEIYIHISRLLSLEIWDQAEITADAQVIRIKVRRWYISPWGHVP